MPRLNCWEYRNCNWYENCPAYKKKLGQMCWIVNATICEGDIQRSVLEKTNKCRNCDYYRYIHMMKERESGASF